MENNIITNEQEFKELIFSLRNEDNKQEYIVVCNVTFSQKDIDDILHNLDTHIKIVNFTFIEDVNFLNLIFHRNIFFKNCKFEKSLRFYNCKKDDVSSDVRINMYKCNIYSLSIDYNEFHHISLEIRNSIILNSWLYETYFKYLWFFDNTILQNKAQIQNISGYVNIKNAIFEEGLYLHSSELENLNILETKFNGAFNISGSFIDKLFIQDNIFSEQADIYFNCGKENILTSKFQFSQNECFKAVVFAFSNVIDDMTLENNVFKANLSLKKIENPKITSDSIKELKIIFSSLGSGNIITENIKIDTIHLNNINEKTNAIFNEVEFRELHIKNMSNYGNIIFGNCKKLQLENSKSIINISDSQLGKTSFSNFDFDSFEEININNSTLTEITTSNVGWFDFKKLNISNPSKNEDTNKNNETDNNTNKDIKNENPKTKYLKNQREIYRQLKQATEKQGDRIQALAFQAEELKVFREELSNKKGSWNDKFTLTLSYTNDFGLNWLRAFYWLLGFTIVFAGLLFFFCVESENISRATNIWNYFSGEKPKQLTGWYLFQKILVNLLDISQPMNKVVKLNLFGEFLAVLYKLVFAFFSFQMVSAFRKYAKSS